VSRVVCAPISTYSAPWAAWLLSQWTRQVSGSTTYEAFPYTHPLMPSTRQDRPQLLLLKSSLWPERRSIWKRVLNVLYPTLPWGSEVKQVGETSANNQNKSNHLNKTRRIWNYTYWQMATTEWQTRSQILRFRGGKIHFTRGNFCFYYMFKTNFSGHNQIWGGTKQIWGDLPTNAPLSTGLPRGNCYGAILLNKSKSYVFILSSKTTSHA